MVSGTTIKKMIPPGVKNTIKQGIQLLKRYKLLKKKHQIKPVDLSRYPNGINLIGDIQAETGLGQSMRILANILLKNQIPFCIVQVDQPAGLRRNNHDWDFKITNKPLYNINILHINASEWIENYNKLDNEIFDYRKNIAYWLWELEEFPSKWEICIKTIDEVWAPSEFVCNSIQKLTVKPVRKLPYAIEIEPPSINKRIYFNLPEDVFLFLVMYDCHSVSERKNPKGTIEAFKQAFTPEEANRKKIGLILKVNHGEFENKLDNLKKELREYKYIFYITDVLTRDEVYALEAMSDVLISLHRSEGYGLAIAEAMSLGTSVITTNWSATTEFTSKETACLVDYKLITLKHAIGPYKKGSRWAEADISQAAKYMKILYENPEYRMNMEKAAQNYIRKEMNSKCSGDFINKYCPNIKMNREGR